MSKSKFYEVWTIDEDGSFGVFLLNSTFLICCEYVEQAVAKGADRATLRIINQDDSPFENE